MARKDPKITHISPKVEFQYVNLSTPDPKYGNYKTKGVAFQKSDIAEIVDLCRSLAVDNGYAPAGVKPSWEATKRKTGCVRMFFGKVGTPIYKTPEEGYYFEAKTNFAPALYDPYGNPYPEADLPKVGSGSTGKLKVAYTLLDHGGDDVLISARLKEAQIISLRAYGGGFGDASEEIEDDEEYGLAPAAGQVTDAAPAAAQSNTPSSGDFEREEDEAHAEEDAADW